MNEPTIEQLMELLEESFLPQSAENTEATILFHLLGEQGGDWTAEIKNMSCSVRKHNCNAPDLTLQAEAHDIIDLFMGRLDPLKAFFSGRLKVQGDQKLAFQLSTFFKISN